MDRNLRHAVIAAIAVASLAGCASMHEAMHGGGGWTTLFDGKSLDNWNRAGDANWRIEDGLIVADKGRGFIVTPQKYQDFEVRVEFWADEEANSGIYYRCTSATDLSNATCYEANIYDKRPTPYGSGAIVDVTEIKPRPMAANHWNTYILTVKGDHHELVMNGVKTEGHDTKRTGAGYIGLQRFDGLVKDKGTIKFRKVEIKPL